MNQCWLNLHLLNLPVLLDQTWSELPIILRAFLANLLKQSLITFSKSNFPTSHMLFSLVSKRKVMCYDAKSLTLFYLLMLAATS